MAWPLPARTPLHVAVLGEKVVPPKLTPANVARHAGHTQLGDALDVVALAEAASREVGMGWMA